MYLTLLIFIYCLNIAFITSWTIFSIAMLALVIVSVLHLVACCDGWYKDSVTKYFKKQLWKTWIKRLIVIVSVTFIIGAVVNEPKKLIGMVMANQVDKYIAENSDAIYKPQEILDTIDKGIREIERLIESK